MKKCGFTLIELLVVIILIAAIVLLALPKITNSVNNYNTNVDKITFNLIKEATKLYVSDNENSFIKRSENTYCVSLNELIEENYLKNTIQYNNQDITNTKVIKVTYENGFNYELVDKKACEKVIKFDTVCELVSGEEKTIGSKYECNFGGGVRNFYILELGSNPVTGST
jgi:prepilin-type N-terminal cleavage/methylation domain-containing protein